MQATILNLFSNVKMSNKDLKEGHGQRFLIAVDGEKILYDTGLNGKTLLKNMDALSISPDEITKLVLSHGHIDHTGGLSDFLEKRSTKKLTLIAHPSFREEKIYKVLNFFKKTLSCPPLTRTQENKLDIRTTAEPEQVTLNLKTTGEITERPEKCGLEPNAKHIENSKYVVDPVRDDLGLILNTKNGSVIITGCGHSGILNICNHVKQLFNSRILAIVGGTHMVRYSEDDVRYVASKLEKEYDNPDLYLNHCTDYLPDPFVKKTKASDILIREMGKEKVKDCFVGTEIRFEV